MKISKLKVVGLNNVYSYDIDIEDNTLILVGENGTGKSTVLSILKSIVSRQWDNLSDVSFKKISINIDGQDYSFTKRELKLFTEGVGQVKSVSKSRASVYIKRLVNRYNLDPLHLLNSPAEQLELINELRSTYGVGVNHTLLENVLYSLSEIYHLNVDNSVSLLDGVIKKLCKFQVIYLPTYRRIERELSSIIPNVEKDYKYDYELEQNLKKINNKQQLELVEFGMGDVKRIINDSLSSLEESFRTGMKALMGQYLQDIILHKHESLQSDALKDIEPKKLEKMLLRIDSDTLSDEIKTRVTDNILNVENSKEVALSDSDLVISYFIKMLIDFHNKQSEEEYKVKSLINVCNKYLVRKKLDYNSVKFELKIFHTYDDGRVISKNDIPFEALSSGEKQIVSLFSHLILSETKSFMIIIDEPELSLSVDWQRSFLEDVKSSNNCRGLFSVTHSPFVFDNSLDKYARSISEFMELS